jgi:hypothetical protein
MESKKYTYHAWLDEIGDYIITSNRARMTDKFLHDVAIVMTKDLNSYTSGWAKPEAMYKCINRTDGKCGIQRVIEIKEVDKKVYIHGKKVSVIVNTFGISYLTVD